MRTAAQLRPLTVAGEVSRNQPFAPARRIGRGDGRRRRSGYPLNQQVFAIKFGSAVQAIGVRSL